MEHISVTRNWLVAKNSEIAELRATLTCVRELLRQATWEDASFYVVDTEELAEAVGLPWQEIGAASRDNA